MNERNLFEVGTEVADGERAVLIRFRLLAVATLIATVLVLGFAH